MAPASHIRLLRRPLNLAWPLLLVFVLLALLFAAWLRIPYRPARAPAPAPPRMAFVELSAPANAWQTPRPFTARGAPEPLDILHIETNLHRPPAAIPFRGFDGGQAARRPEGLALPRLDDTTPRRIFPSPAPPPAPLPRVSLQTEAGLLRTGFQVTGDPDAWPETPGEAAYWVELDARGRVLHLLVLEGDDDARGVMLRWVERGRAALPAAATGILRVQWW